jgi:hypothetical protein
VSYVLWKLDYFIFKKLLIVCDLELKQNVLPASATGGATEEKSTEE